MKVLISLLPLETPYQPDRWPRPLGLWRLAGRPIIAHVLGNLHLLLKAPSAEVRFATRLKSGPIATWIQEQYAGFGAHMELVASTGIETVVQAAWQMRDWLAHDEPVWLLETTTILEADFDGDQNDLDVKALLPVAGNNQAPAGIYFKTGKRLLATLSRLHEPSRVHESPRAHESSRAHDFPRPFDLQSLRDWLLNENQHQVKPITVGVTHAYTYLPVAERSEEGWQTHDKLILQTHARLLGLGSGSENAIERSYVEDFTVLPPVYLHESAAVYGAVIGPYTSVEAGASIRGSVVSNSILGAGAQVSNVILDGTIIGEGAVLSGRADSLLLGDNQISEK